MMKCIGTSPNLPMFKVGTNYQSTTDRTLLEPVTSVHSGVFKMEIQHKCGAVWHNRSEGAQFVEVGNDL